MCGRYSHADKVFDLAKAYGVTYLEELLFDEKGRERFSELPNNDCRPTAFLPVIANDNPTLLRLFRWGLVPAWANLEKQKLPLLINARVETVEEKPAFRKAYQVRRCLVPASAYYEWQSLPSGKQQIAYRVKDASYLTMAGLWETWKGPTGAVLHSFTVLTTEPNPLAAVVHDRMPVLLREDQQAQWLSEPIPVAELAQPFPQERMVAENLVTGERMEG